jgi:hypothetical protein
MMIIEWLNCRTLGRAADFRMELHYNNMGALG